MPQETPLDSSVELAVEAALDAGRIPEVEPPSRRATMRRIWQTAGYVASNLTVQGLGAIVATMLARELTVSEFGGYSFASSSLVFLALFFEFGLFVPASRMAAKESPEEGNRLFGAALIAFAPVAAAYAVAVFVLSFFVDSWFNVHAGDALRVIAPLAFVYPFDLVAQQMAQGLDRLHVYSWSAVVGRALLAAIAIGLVVSHRLSVTTALAAEAIGLLIGWVVLIGWLRPVFHDVRRRIGELVQAARDYGFVLYVGRVLAIGTYNMDVLMVAALADAKAVSYYTIAGGIAAPVGMPAAAMAAALFPRMVNERRIQRRWLVGSVVVGGVLAILASVLAPIFIRIVLSEQYHPVIALVPPLAMAWAVRGVTTVYNSFLTGHARGRELRNASVVLTVSNVILNLLLIPTYGAAGAAWASLGALVANFFVHFISYRKMTKDDVAAAM